MRTRSLWLLLLLGGFPAPLSAHEFSYSALLTGPAQSPPNTSAGIGIALITFDLDVVTMRVELTFSGLTGTVTAANLHAPTAAPGLGTAGIASPVPTFPGFPSGVTAGSYDETLDLALASSYNPDFITSSGGTISDALNNLFFSVDAGQAYLNIRTSAFPNGEIRGFLIAVPEPSTLVLLLVTSLGFGLYRWRTRESEARAEPHTSR